MLRRCICLLCVFCVLSVMGVGAKGAEQVGSVRIMPRWCGQPVVGGIVSLCRVGKKTEQGYQMTDGLANWTVSEDELSEDFLIWLRHHAEADILFSPVGEKGAEFQRLEEGVYLAEQTETVPDYKPFVPFLICIPEGEYWNLEKNPMLIYHGESPKTADHPAPIIGAMGIGLSVAILMVMIDERKR